MLPHVRGLLDREFSDGGIVLVERLGLGVRLGLEHLFGSGDAVVARRLYEFVSDDLTCGSNPIRERLFPDVAQLRVGRRFRRCQLVAFVLKAEAVGDPPILL